MDESVEGGVVISPASALGKEMLKWEQHGGPLGRNPGNPYQYRPYPKMLYKAVRKAGGKVVCTDNPMAYDTEREQLEAERINRQCYRTVGDEVEERNAKNEGWRESPDEAMAAHKQRQDATSNAAAEVQYAVRRMGKKAQRELADADASTSEHVVDVKPARKRGRPAKETEAVTE